MKTFLFMILSVFFWPGLTASRLYAEDNSSLAKSSVDYGVCEYIKNAVESRRLDTVTVNDYSELKGAYRDFFAGDFDGLDIVSDGSRCGYGFESDEADSRLMVVRSPRPTGFECHSASQQVFFLNYQGLHYMADVNSESVLSGLNVYVPSNKPNVPYKICSLDGHIEQQDVHIEGDHPICRVFGESEWKVEIIATPPASESLEWVSRIFNGGIDSLRQSRFDLDNDGLTDSVIIGRHFNGASAGCEMDFILIPEKLTGKNSGGVEKFPEGVLVNNYCDKSTLKPFRFQNEVFLMASREDGMNILQYPKNKLCHITYSLKFRVKRADGRSWRNRENTITPASPYILR